MFAVQIPIVEKILRTVLVYATILILFRPCMTLLITSAAKLSPFRMSCGIGRGLGSRAMPRSLRFSS
jgi:hypothetical protein